MAEIKALIFDLDGVIVDTAVFHYQAWKQIADELGIAFTEKDNELLKGVSRVRSFEIMLGLGDVQLSQEEKDKYLSRKNEVFVELISSMKPEDVLPGVVEFIREQKAKGRKIALGSASKNAVTVLTNTGLMDVFEVIIDGTKVSAAKPDPEVFLKGADELGIAPENCVVFEDAQAGVEAALNGGMYCIGIGDEEVLGKAHWVVSGIGNIDLKGFDARLASL